MALGALIIKAHLSLTDEELVEQIKENLYLQFFIGLEAFQYSAPFDPSKMVYFRKWLPESVVNDCNETIVYHGLNVIRSADSEDDGNDSGMPSSDRPAQPGSDKASSNQGSLLIDATCIPADIRYPTDLSLLNEAREVTEKMIDTIHPLVRNPLAISVGRIARILDSSFKLWTRKSNRASTRSARPFSSKCVI